MIRVKLLQVITTGAPIIRLNVQLSGEEKEVAYGEIPFVPELECLELPFPPTFTEVRVLLTLFAMN